MRPTWSAAKAASWTLRNAQITLDDAKETWDDAQSDYRASREQYLLQQAEHTWNAAQLTYQSTVQSFETSFKNLYNSLANYEQVLESAPVHPGLAADAAGDRPTRYSLGLIPYCGRPHRPGQCGHRPVHGGQCLAGSVHRPEQLPLGGGVWPDPRLLWNGT